MSYCIQLVNHLIQYNLIQLMYRFMNVKDKRGAKKKRHIYGRVNLPIFNAVDMYTCYLRWPNQTVKSDTVRLKMCFQSKHYAVSFSFSSFCFFFLSYYSFSDKIIPFFIHHHNMLSMIIFNFKNSNAFLLMII